MQRRTVLKLAGATVGVGALSAASMDVTARPDEVIDLGNEGLQPGDDLSPYLDDYWQDGREVHIPGGDYELSDPDSLGISAGSDAWLVGDGDVYADHGETHVEFNIVSNNDAHVRIQNVTLNGIDDSDSSNDGKIRVWADDDAGLVELVNFNRPDGSKGGGEATGLFVPNPHAGMARFVNCHIEGFTDNGLYASSYAEGDSNDGMGTVEVYGGLWKNNNVNNIRVGGDDAKVISAVSVVDDVPNGQDSGYRRGIRVREAGENQIIHDCDLYAADVSGAGPPIQTKDEKFEGPGPSDVTVTDTRITNDLGKPAIKTDDPDFNIEGDTIELTGDGDYELQGDGPFTNVITGSDAEPARTEKRWVDGWGDVPDGAGDTSGSTDTSSTSLAVSTTEPTSVGATTATLAGSLESLGGATGASVYFEHRKVGASDWRSTSPEPAEETGTFEATVDLLDKATEYEYRAVAETVDESSTGEAVSFSTSFDHYLRVQTFDDSGIVYSYTVDGQVKKAEEAGSNDSITDNGDGTVTVEGETGNGFYDDYYFNGQVTAFSADTHPEETNGDYEIYLDGDLVTVEELTGQSDGSDSTDDTTDQSTDDTTDETTDSSGSGSNPTISTFDVSEAGSPNPHLDVTSVWEVADGDGDLSWVLVQIVNDSGFVVDAAKTSVSGSSAADVDYFKIKKVDGQSFTVKLTVSDATGNTTTVSKSVSE